MIFSHAVDVTPDDDNDLSNPMSIYVVTTGNVTLVPQKVKIQSRLRMYQHTLYYQFVREK